MVPDKGVVGGMTMSTSKVTISHFPNKQIKWTHTSAAHSTVIGKSAT